MVLAGEAEVNQRLAVSLGRWCSLSFPSYFCFYFSVGGKFGSANVFCATARPWPFAVFAGGFNVCLRVPCAPPASLAAKLNTDVGGGG